MIQSSRKDWHIFEKSCKMCQSFRCQSLYKATVQNSKPVPHSGRKLFEKNDVLQSISDAKNAKLRRDENCESQG